MTLFPFCMCKINIKHLYWVKCLPLFFSNGIITSYHQPMRKLSPTHLKPLKKEDVLSSGKNCQTLGGRHAHETRLNCIRREPAHFFHYKPCLIWTTQSVFCTWSIWSGSPGFCPWHPGNPCHGISSVGCHQRRNIHQGLHWWQPAESPSSLEKVNEWKLSKRLETNLSYNIQIV